MEIVIKRALKRQDFQTDPEVLHAGLQFRGFTEIPLTTEQVLLVAGLPAIHKDPFDRVLIAQAQFADFTLMTADAKIAKYPGNILSV